ncbi:hypothetical protein BDV93DRAFT_528367 [Ceratobasidium sp. AG-I]|nr:hypothetical protein BDV93DRAFT_528367 [Ceratobasidium sp. AG-I]
MSFHRIDSIPQPSALNSASIPDSGFQHLPLELNQAAAIPELLRFISSFLSRNDAFHFAQCSRLFFQSAVENIWKKLLDIHCLVNLLPAMRDGATDKTSNFPTNGLVRFEFYASLVKHLELCEYVDCDNTVGWPILVRYAQHKPLLPNLRRLVFDSDAVARDLSWLNMFLSPSLLSITLCFTVLGLKS